MSKDIINEEKIEEEAKLEAASDIQQNEEVDKAYEQARNDFSYKVRFKLPYTFEGKEYTELDLSGLMDMTQSDAEYLDRVMQRMNHRITGNKFDDSLYIKHVAMKATGLPIEFFSNMKWSNFEDVRSTIKLYFLLF